MVQSQLTNYFLFLFKTTTLGSTIRSSSVIAKDMPFAHCIDPNVCARSIEWRTSIESNLSIVSGTGKWWTPPAQTSPSSWQCGLSWHRFRHFKYSNHTPEFVGYVSGVVGANWTGNVQRCNCNGCSSGSIGIWNRATTTANIQKRNQRYFQLR